MKTSPTTAELQKGVSVICKVIGQIPYFHIYEHFIARPFKTKEEEALNAMSHNAALDSTLINVRCFNEFFKPNGHPDDIRAYHYPGVLLDPFLRADQELEIHRHLAHLTRTRANIEAKSWVVDAFMGAGLQRGIEFLHIIDASFPSLTDSDRSEVFDLIHAATGVLKRLSNQNENP